MLWYACQIGRVVYGARLKVKPSYRGEVKWVFWSTNVGVGSNPTSDKYFYYYYNKYLFYIITQDKSFLIILIKLIY